MRISDWSSDVCSSDLLSYTVPEPIGIVGIIITWNGPLISLGMKVCAALAAGNCVICKPAEITPFAPEDRKSVVEGKSVSVRVDLGGRRIIKKTQIIRHSMNNSIELTDQNKKQT